MEFKLFKVKKTSYVLINTHGSLWFNRATLDVTYKPGNIQRNLNLKWNTYFQLKGALTSLHDLEFVQTVYGYIGKFEVFSSKTINRIIYLYWNKTYDSKFFSRVKYSIGIY